MNTKIEDLSTDYYEISFSITMSDSGAWSGEATVRRRDTGEEVRGGCVKYGMDKDKIIETIYDELKHNAAFFSTQPPEWQSKGRAVLYRCHSLSQKTSGFNLFISQVTDKDIQSGYVHQKFGEFLEGYTSETVRIVSEIMCLSSQERLGLLVSKEEAYLDPTDPWNLDDLTVRADIYKFISQPTADEKKAYEGHVLRTKEAVSGLGDGCIESE